MRSNVYDTMPNWFRGVPLALTRNGTIYEYREILPVALNERARARATVLAGLLVAGLVGLVLVGLIALLGAVGFGIWHLWS
jgi:hypothetical protein